MIFFIQLSTFIISSYHAEVKYRLKSRYNLVTFHHNLIIQLSPEKITYLSTARQTLDGHLLIEELGSHRAETKW